MKVKLLRNTVARDAGKGVPMAVLAGEIYDVVPDDARLLIQMGYAKPVDEEKNEKKGEANKKPKK